MFMKKTLVFLGASIAPLLLAGEPATVADALAAGKFSLNARLRLESVEQTGLRDADAFTLRTRAGYSTAPLRGWKATVEVENIVAANSDAYNQAGINPGGAGRAVVADPEITELNRAFVSWAPGKISATAGRQSLVLDNARFIGDVGWRQNQQTFDAVVLQDRHWKDTVLTYAYLDRINRVFGRDHPQGRWRSDSHVLHASRAGLPLGTLTAYACLLDFANSPVNSTATFGASFAGSTPLSGSVSLAYRAELATQRDHGNSPLLYRAVYHMIELGLVGKRGGVAAFHERLGADNGTGFKTPLATLHAFNGWADLFLSTPNAGLRDTCIKANASLPAGLSLAVEQHWFESDAGADLGREFNVRLSRKFGTRVTVLAKSADFRAESPQFPDVRKFWLQAEFAY